MLLAEAAKEASKFEPFDIMMVLFTLVIFVGLIRSVKAREKNKFAIGFAAVSLLVFLASDVIMVAHWFGVDLKLS